MSAAIQKSVRVSSVPEQGFKCPRNIEDLYALADAASDIMSAAIEHIKDVDFDAWVVISKRYSEIVDAFVWIGHAKWIGSDNPYAGVRL